MPTVNDHYRELEAAKKKNRDLAFLPTATPNFYLGGRPLLVIDQYTNTRVPYSALRGHVLYRFFDAKRNTLYIGMTRHLPIRCWGSKNWGPRSGHRHRTWWPDVHLVTVETCPTREELEKLETAAIRNESPKYNVLDQFSSRGITVTTRNGHRIHGETL